jgi:hypothetical protein
MSNKKGGAAGVAFIIMLLALLGVALYLLWINLPQDPVELKILDNGIEEDEPPVQANYESSKQFYENMRFSDKIISYRIEPACGAKKSDEVSEAFAILGSESVLTFFPTSDNPQIRIFCSEVEPEPDEEGFFVAGEGGPTRVINTSLYSVILDGKVSFFREEKCDKPNVALHEILHVLGFDHNDNPDSILFPTLDCDQTIDQSIIDDINVLYSVDSAVDLKIENIEASKAGKYLSFEINVLNQGLKDVSGAGLKVYADNKFIQEFDLNDIDIGTTKILTVENLKIARSSKKVSFVVDEENKIKEIIEDNNEIDVVLVEE